MSPKPEVFFCSQNTSFCLAHAILAIPFPSRTKKNNNLELSWPVDLKAPLEVLTSSCQNEWNREAPIPLSLFMSCGYYSVVQVFQPLLYRATG